MAMKNGPVEDVLTIENGDFHCHVSFYWRVVHVCFMFRFIGFVVCVNS